MPYKEMHFVWFCLHKMSKSYIYNSLQHNNTGTTRIRNIQSASRPYNGPKSVILKDFKASKPIPKCKLKQFFVFSLFQEKFDYHIWLNKHCLQIISCSLDFKSITGDSQFPLKQ